MSAVSEAAPVIALPDGAPQAGELAELLRVFNDVTARLEGTQETLRSEVRRLQAELEQANAQLRRTRELAALGEMAAGIAHEIRNPLGSIKLYAEALAQDLAGRPEECVTARKIGSAVDGLNRVVGDVLAFAREVRLRPGPCDPLAILTRAADEVRCELMDAGAEVEVDAAGDGMIEADADLLRLAVVNLVRNAAEAVRDGDLPRRVRLTAGPGSRRGADGRRTPCLAIAVEDSGPGIAADVVSRMFNPFFTTRAAGTGLGLAIVHRIIDAHGGAIEVGRSPAVAEGGLGGARVAALLPFDRTRALEPTAPQTTDSADRLPERAS